MKKLFSILVICFVLLFSGCKAQQREVYPPFFKVTDEQTGGVVYLLGTMHVGEKNSVLPEAVYSALRDCGTLAVEVDLIALDADQNRLLDAMKLLECQGGTAADYLGEDYKEIRAFFRKKHLYNAAYDKYIPAVWSSVLTSEIASDCGYFSDYGTDRVLLSYAKANSIEVVELETVEQQYSINANEPRALQSYLLKEAAETDWELQKSQMRELYAAWSESDFSALERLIAEDGVPEELSEEYAEFYFEMYENRQAAMSEYIINTLKNGEKAFVAVGAMHYFASPDILDNLENAGYTIEVLSE